MYAKHAINRLYFFVELSDLATGSHADWVFFNDNMWG